MALRASPSGRFITSPDGSILIDNDADTIQVNGSGVYQSQTQWIVDSVNGDDSASGLPGAPLRSVTELSRRLTGGVFDQAVDVSLIGDFLTETLELDIVANALFTVAGIATVIHSGTISAVTPTDPAASVRGIIEDAAAPFTGLDGARLRLTSGAMTGAIAYITREIAADTVNVSRWALSDPATTVAPTIGEPAIGDTYVIETINTRIGQLDIDNRGVNRFLLRDLAIESVEAHRVTNNHIQHAGIVFYTCTWEGVAATIYRSDMVWLSCRAPTIVALAFSTHIAPRACVFAGQRVQVGIQSSIDFQRANCFDGSRLNVVGGSQVGVTGAASGEGDLQFCDFTGGEMILVSVGSVLETLNATALLWGTDNGTVTCTFRVLSGGGMYYLTVPTIQGAPVGQDVRIGGTDGAYTDLPIINAANGAAMVVRA